MFGLMLAGLISERFGRKKALLTCSLLQILISVGVHFSSSFTTLLIALTLSGGFNTMILNPSYAFLSEISLIRDALKTVEENLLSSQYKYSLDIYN